MPYQPIATIADEILLGRHKHNSLAPLIAQTPYPFGCKFRKPITITGTAAGAQTDYPIKVILTFVSGHMLPDYSDVVFTDANGYRMNYWQESMTASSTATYWIKIPSIPASPSTVTIYACYGSGYPMNFSEGRSVFSFFDDWSAYNGAFSFSLTIGNLRTDAGYVGFGITVRKDANTLIHITRKGTSHASDKGSLVTSTFNALTGSWGVYSTIYTDAANYDSRNCAGGVIGNTIYLFFGRYDLTGAVWHDMGYITSTDWGAPWSPIPIGWHPHRLSEHWERAIVIFLTGCYRCKGIIICHSPRHNIIAVSAPRFQLKYWSRLVRSRSSRRHWKFLERFHWDYSHRAALRQ